MAERLTNWTLVEGRLVPLDEATRIAAAGTGYEVPRKFDAAAADLWEILARGAAFERRSVTRIGWLIGRKPVQPSAPLQKWMDEHVAHPLAPVVGTLAPQ